MPGKMSILHSGQIWSSPTGTNGLGGVGRSVALGELALEDPTCQQATLTLGYQNMNPGATLGQGRIYAIIKYGIGAANQTVAIDWCQGQTICLPAGKVHVTALQVDSKGAPWIPLPAGYSVTPAEDIAVPVILTASLAAGSRSSISHPTLSQSVNIAAGATIPWQCPVRAKRVLVSDSRGQGATDLTARVVGSLANAFYNLANAADSAIRTDGVVLGGLADNVQLASVAGVINVSLCWMLDG
jgi:hypothetical protein